MGRWALGHAEFWTSVPSSGASWSIISEAENNGAWGRAAGSVGGQVLDNEKAPQDLFDLCLALSENAVSSKNHSLSEEFPVYMIVGEMSNADKMKWAHRIQMNCRICILAEVTMIKVHRFS